ncbi:MAG: transglycosylase domain-containing protein [Bryobacterales bacterium]
MRAAPDGPYDHRLGYSRLPAMLERLHAEGFEIEAQAQWSPELAEWVDAGLFPIYQEKPQAGFTLLDRNGELLHRSPHPQRLYPSFAAIPQSVVESLLFIENRDMLDARFATRNPAIEWDRLSKAGLDLGLRSILPSHPVSGGSTLATQLEKLRHSEGGRTEGVHEKLRQIASASIRACEEPTDPRRAAASSPTTSTRFPSPPSPATAKSSAWARTRRLVRRRLRPRKPPARRRRSDADSSRRVEYKPAPTDKRSRCCSPCAGPAISLSITPRTSLRAPSPTCAARRPRRHQHGAPRPGSRSDAYAPALCPAPAARALRRAQGDR